jgi:hypothetical protein
MRFMWSKNRQRAAKLTDNTLFSVPRAVCALQTVYVAIVPSVALAADDVY